LVSAVVSGLATQIDGSAPPRTAPPTPEANRYACALVTNSWGRGGDLIVIDDPIKALDALSEAERRRVWEFYIGTLCTRLDDKKNGAIMIVMQRLHADDLVGRILDLEGEIWEVVSIPAIADEDKVFQLSDDPEDASAEPAKCCMTRASRWACSRPSAAHRGV
jgi:hypothetical protein